MISPPSDVVRTTLRPCMERKQIVQRRVAPTRQACLCKLHAEGMGDRTHTCSMSRALGVSVTSSRSYTLCATGPAANNATSIVEPLTDSI